MTDPSDAEIDAALGRIEALAGAALQDHPRRDRVLEMLATGAQLFCHREGSRFEFVVGWFDDPRMRPADADPAEVIALMKLPRRVILGATTASDS